MRINQFDAVLLSVSSCLSITPHVANIPSPIPSRTVTDASKSEANSRATVLVLFAFRAATKTRFVQTLRLIPMTSAFVDRAVSRSSNGFTERVIFVLHRIAAPQLIPISISISVSIVCVTAWNRRGFLFNLPDRRFLCWFQRRRRRRGGDCLTLSHSNVPCTA